MTEPRFSISEAARHPLPSGLIHDLRTPLNLIIGYSEMLMEQAQEQGQESFVADLERICIAGQQLLALINDNFYPSGALVTPAGIPTPRHEHLTPPEAGPAAEGHSESVAPGESATGTAQGFLLIVDDIEANRYVLSRRLERQGYEVATAENGRQALEMLRADTFDLVLLDIMMPEMDGYEVLQCLKADGTLRRIPVIMISALTELDAVVRCIEMGAEDYLPKPFNPVLLKARIGACLEKKRARDRETHFYGQLQENYKRLQELEKLRDDLTHMIIHDLRTPLNTMFLGMMALEQMGALNQSQREMLNITMEGGETLLGIVNDLLDINKMESGLLQLELQEIAAADLVGAALKQVAALAGIKNLTLTTELEPGLPRLPADKAKVVRILVNLLSNAVKFTPPGGTVTVAIRRDERGSSLLFSVSDTGEGIPSEAFGRIFEKFGQVESRQGGRTMSTGLGLTFCKLAVEAHGGHIGVESVPGQGSTFYFRIPISDPADGASSWAKELSRAQSA